MPREMIQLLIFCSFLIFLKISYSFLNFPNTIIVDISNVNPNSASSPCGKTLTYIKFIPDYVHIFLENRNNPNLSPFRLENSIFFSNFNIQNHSPSEIGELEHQDPKTS